MPRRDDPLLDLFPAPKVPRAAADASAVAPFATPGRSIGPDVGRRALNARPATALEKVYDLLAIPFENLSPFAEITYGTRAASEAIRGHAGPAAMNAAVALSAPLIGGVLGRVGARSVTGVVRDATRSGTWHLVANEARDLSLLASRTPEQAKRLTVLSTALRRAPQDALPPIEHSALGPGARNSLSDFIGTGPESITPADLAKTRVIGRVDPATWKVSPAADETFAKLERRRAERLLPPSPDHQALLDGVRGGMNAPGFTLEPSGEPFGGTGYLVADPAMTAPLKSMNDAVQFLARDDVKAALKGGGKVGGWRSPETGAGEINITRPIADQKQAIDLGRKWKQHSIGEMRDGEYVRDVPVGEPQQITGPALRIGGKVYSSPWPEAHSHVLAKVQNEYTDRAIASGVNERHQFDKYYEDVGKATAADEGFVLANGDFVTREQGYDLAEKNGQLIPGRVERNRQAARDLHAYDLNRPREAPAPAAPSVIETSQRGRTLHDALLADEQALMTKRNIPAFEAAAKTLPSAETFGAGALAGAAKRGWYANSSRALVQTFGPDAPRFAALLSALSPQRGVQDNLGAAMSMWEAWIGSGRPTDPQRLKILLNQVERAQPGGKAMEARVGNALRALTAEDPVNLVLSGPKVNAFHKNLIGDTQRVTLDTWMAQLGNLNPKSIGGLKREGILQADPRYLAYSGRIRETADMLSKLTGRTWTPAETQETLWSWGKALSENAMPSTKGMHPSEIAHMDPADLRSAIATLPEAAVRGVPDFSTLLSQPGPFQESLGRMGLPLPGRAPPAPPAATMPDIFELDQLARNIEKSRRNQFGAASPAMLGGMTGAGIGAAGAPFLWNYLHNKQPSKGETFQDWLKRNQVTDYGDPRSFYDYEAAYRAGAERGPGGHFPDTWKLPGHPTFSNESVYADSTAPMWAPPIAAKRY